MMMKPSDLDLAHAAMMSAPEDEAARLAYFHHLADSELFVLLEGDPVDDRIAPRVWPFEDGRLVLVFDSEERLARFSDSPVPYAALPGRVIVAGLAGQGVGLGINLTVAEAAFVMPVAAVDWLAVALSQAPREGLALPVVFGAPEGTELGAVLERKLAGLADLAAGCWLVSARHGDGRHATAIVFEAARPGAEDGLAKAAGEVVQFAGLDPVTVDVLFLSAAQARRAGLHEIGHPVALSAPVPDAAQTSVRVAPGSDPARPPKLR